MGGSITAITSESQFNQVLHSNTFVVVDFYADWCGPCKTIAPVFSQLADAEAKPGRMAFVKVDVDSQQGIARQYGISAMPTFLILKNGKVHNTLRGADPNGLRTAVKAAAAEASKGGAQSSAAFHSTGHVLGNKPSTSRAAPAPAAGQGLSQTIDQYARAALRQSPTSDLVRFVGLYATTLFSLDPHSAAEASVFNVRNTR